MNSAAEDPLADQLQQLIRAIELSAQAILPRSDDELLHSIVSTAVRIFGASAASILLVDETDQTLVFRVEVGNKQPDLVGRRIPMDRGIAGYVAMTGQSIAVSNVAQDKRFNVEFAQSTGYIPDSILATPLILEDRVIGVLEVLDKIAASSFGLQDMELMGIFAHQSAVAIRQAQQLEMIDQALRRGLLQLAAGEGLPNSQALADALEGSRRSTPEMDDLFTLAGLFNDLSRLGAAERRVGLKIMTALAEYGRSRSRPRL